VTHDRFFAFGICFSALEEREMDAIDEQSEIIIAGHGRVGGIVSRLLRGRSIVTMFTIFGSLGAVTLSATPMTAR
jgi:hypothetical protein